MEENPLRVLLLAPDPAEAGKLGRLLQEARAPRAELIHVDRLDAACERLAAEPPHLVLLDLAPSAGAGTEEVTVVRCAAPAVPVVVLTEGARAAAALQAMRAGAQDYLFKEELEPPLLARSIQYAIERRRLERERARAEEALRFLAQAGARLASSLDYEATLRQVARLTVPALADWCVIHTRERGGETRRVELIAADPDLDERLGALPDPYPPMRQLVERALAGGRSVLLEELPEGGLRALGAASVMVVPLTAHGRALGTITLAATVARRRFSSGDLEVAEELARSAALAIDNARLYREAQQAMRAREEVLGFVAHDLRNPLSVVNMTALLLLGTPLPEEEREEQLRVILRSTERMDELIQDLLDVARIDAGAFRVDAGPVSARGLLEAARELMEPAAAERGVRLALDAVADLPPVHADARRILRVLANLVGNAIKFTPPAGRIVLRAERSGAEVVFGVADTGVGIATPDLPHLFNRFWQAEASRQQGTGLGLPIAKGIVDAHGGKIWATSRPGAGSTFFFSLPQCEAGQARVEILGADASVAGA